MAARPWRSPREPNRTRPSTCPAKACRPSAVDAALRGCANCHGSGRVRDCDCVLQSAVEWQRALLQTISQRLALDVLQDQVVHAVLVADVVERADVRVVQVGNGAGFALEPLARVGVTGHT